MILNETSADLEKKLCPTDSRFRPDIRFLEEGRVDESSSEKTRLEQKQRDKLKSRKSRKDSETKAKLVLFSPHISFLQLACQVLSFFGALGCFLSFNCLDCDIFFSLFLSPWSSSWKVVCTGHSPPHETRGLVLPRRFLGAS